MRAAKPRIPPSVRLKLALAAKSKADAKANAGIVEQPADGAPGKEVNRALGACTESAGTCPAQPAPAATASVHDAGVPSAPQAGVAPGSPCNGAAPVPAPATLHSVGARESADGPTPVPVAESARASDTPAEAADTPAADIPAGPLKPASRAADDEPAAGKSSARRTDTSAGTAGDGAAGREDEGSPQREQRTAASACVVGGCGGGGRREDAGGGGGFAAAGEVGCESGDGGVADGKVRRETALVAAAIPQSAEDSGSVEGNKESCSAEASLHAEGAATAPDAAEVVPCGAPASDAEDACRVPGTDDSSNAVRTPDAGAGPDDTHTRSGGADRCAFAACGRACMQTPTSDPAGSVQEYCSRCVGVLKLVQIAGGSAMHVRHALEETGGEASEYEVLSAAMRATKERPPQSAHEAVTGAVLAALADAPAAAADVEQRCPAAAAAAEGAAGPGDDAEVSEGLGLSVRFTRIRLHSHAVCKAGCKHRAGKLPQGEHRGVKQSGCERMGAMAAAMKGKAVNAAVESDEGLSGVSTDDNMCQVSGCLQLTQRPSESKLRHGKRRKTSHGRAPAASTQLSSARSTLSQHTTAHIPSAQRRAVARNTTAAPAARLGAATDAAESDVAMHEVREGAAAPAGERRLGTRLEVSSEVVQQERWKVFLIHATLTALHKRVALCVQGQQYVYCPDITAGAERFPIPAIIDDPAGLRASGAAPPPLFPPGFTYAVAPAGLPMTPAARRFLDTVYPASRPADMWAGCKHTEDPAKVIGRLREEGSVRLGKGGRLEALGNHTPLVECEPGCPCPLKSVTARGAFLPLQLFLHQNPDGSPSAVGWGVRCAVDIAAGTFLSTYTGIVAVNSEVPPRSRYTVSLDHYTRACSTLRLRPDDLRTEELHRFPVVPCATLPMATPRMRAFRRASAAPGDLTTWTRGGRAAPQPPRRPLARCTDVIALHPPGNAAGHAGHAGRASSSSAAAGTRKSSAVGAEPRAVPSGAVQSAAGVAEVLRSSSSCDASEAHGNTQTGVADERDLDATCMQDPEATNTLTGVTPARARQAAVNRPSLCATMLSGHSTHSTRSTPSTHSTRACGGSLLEAPAANGGGGGRMHAERVDSGVKHAGFPSLESALQESDRKRSASDEAEGQGAAPPPFRRPRIYRMPHAGQAAVAPLLSQLAALPPAPHACSATRDQPDVTRPAHDACAVQVPQCELQNAPSSATTGGPSSSQRCGEPNGGKVSTCTHACAVAASEDMYAARTEDASPAGASGALPRQQRASATSTVSTEPECMQRVCSHNSNCPQLPAARADVGGVEGERPPAAQHRQPPSPSLASAPPPFAAPEPPLLRRESSCCSTAPPGLPKAKRKMHAGGSTLPSGAAGCFARSAALAPAKAPDGGDMRGGDEMAKKFKKPRPGRRELQALTAQAPGTAPAGAGSEGSAAGEASRLQRAPVATCRWAPYRSREDLPSAQQLPSDAEHLVIDAEAAGSVARFFNHSCDPTVACQNVLLPGAGGAMLYCVAFFADEDIPAMTELRWNYYGVVAGEAAGGSVRCRCGAAGCRKWLC